MGSIAIQLAKLAGLSVIATASRPETAQWVLDLGADKVIDHSQPIRHPMVCAWARGSGLQSQTSATPTHTGRHGGYHPPSGTYHFHCGKYQAARPEFSRAKASHSLFMFTRSMYQTPDMADQGQLLNEVAALIESGKLRTTLNETLSPINAENLRAAACQGRIGRNLFSAIGRAEQTKPPNRSRSPVILIGIPRMD